MEKQRKSFGIMVMSCAAALVMVAGSAQAGDGTININGRVTTGTCTPDRDMIRVYLPHLNVNLLNASGKTAGPTNFEIALSGCPVGVGVRATFEPGNYGDPDTGAYKNAVTGVSRAENVEIAVMDKDGNRIFVGRPQTEEPVTVDSSGKATLTYGAEYLAVGVAQAGTVEVVAHYTVEYL